MHWQIFVNFAFRNEKRVKDSSVKIRAILSVFMLFLFMSYQAGTTLFTHAHIIDGRVITHSHPYNSSAHSHSDAQIFAIAHVSSFLGDEVGKDEVSLKPRCFSALKKWSECQVAVLSHFVEIHCLRAPPFVA